MPRLPVYAFEGIDDALPIMPLAARRLLDATGRKLSLEGWLSLPVESRRAIVLAGAAIRAAGTGAEGTADSDCGDCLARAVPAASFVARIDEPGDVHVPSGLTAALGPSRPLDDARWRALSALDRYALAKCSAKPERLERAYDEIVRTARLTHVSRSGDAHMVDVAEKRITSRRAVASATIRTTTAVVRAIAEGSVSKGDVLAAARIGGIMASKRTAELIPLCHPVQTTSARVDLDLDEARGQIVVVASVEAVDRTGVEMEAMVAASIASLTIYDMIKGSDRWAVIAAVRLERKSGGRSGDVIRPDANGIADGSRPAGSDA
ncbi:MAG TPA: cyclic pyranopterin monophosphate synthase MoaC [Polyangiaceae bacterium]|nr:cyclic pyranopterin monophosphate synthase MoaC [Polyangiaceae bacterium]